MTEVLNPAGMRELRPSLGTVALVPTMGALHNGHLALVELAKRHAETVVVSVFVNPLQFGPNEDFDRYPRPFEADLARLERAGVPYVLHPTVEQLYPNWPATTIVSAGEAGTILEGASRPGHFDGVLTVVAKLFNIVRPTVAVFGEKDAQQLALVRRMVRELHFPLEIVAQPIVREPDGLALSSRNAYLEGDAREDAVVLSRALAAAAVAGVSGVAAARDAALVEFAWVPRVRLDYFEVLDPATFAPVPDGFTGEALAVVAAYVGSTRLIDNRALQVGEAAGN